MLLEPGPIESGLTRRLKAALDHAARGIYQSGELNKTSWRVRRLRRGCPVPGP